ncbi:MAG: sigma-70 family RNA polymerase sigma factor [Bacillota bacterium]|nr:sigma-70 family RNA polymerase sigma factor [Bacillota bacterium]MDW7683971.1 sigma-70 family RNA polymerase sigma factor [Bacillota bacterium]
MYSEAELIEQLKAGNERAVEELLERFGDRLLRTAVGICGDIQIAEEVVQDAMLQACRKIHAFGGHSLLGTWLFRITVNLAKNRLRSGWFKRVSVWDEGKINILPDSDTLQPESAVIRNESCSEILGALGRLPLKYRDVLTLYYLEEFSINEISRILEEPEGTVKSRMSRGRALLKAEMSVKEAAY